MTPPPTNITHRYSVNLGKVAADLDKSDDDARWTGYLMLHDRDGYPLQDLPVAKGQRQYVLDVLTPIAVGFGVPVSFEGADQQQHISGEPG